MLANGCVRDEASMARIEEYHSPHGGLMLESACVRISGFVDRRIRDLLWCISDESLDER